VDPRRAALEGKLKVEQLVLKRAGDKGVEIEVRYRIVDVERYAAHPMITFVADEASGKLVPLTSLQRLFVPAPAKEAGNRPLASLTFWDKEGVIRPGQPVTVVVAGYGQKHLMPVAGPEYDPDAGAKRQAPREEDLSAPDATLTVYEVKVVGQGQLLNVRFSSEGIKRLDPAAQQTYVENPETGRRHPIAQLPDVGVMAQFDRKTGGSSYMMVDNSGARIKPGQRVHVVVSGVRRENVPVTGE
jgi:hypothetical protein